jgi:hypothetical protein
LAGRPGYAEAIERLAAALADPEADASARRAAKRRVPLGQPHCPACVEQRKAGT